jgi:site-specific recombinase
MPRELRPINPRALSESEEHTLRSLLDRSGQSLAAAEAQRARERDQERRLRARQDKLAAEEARLSKRLAELRVDIDTVTAEIYKIAPSSVSFRHVAGKLQEFGDRVPSLSFFNTSADNMDRKQLMLLGEIALSLYEQAARPKGKPLREKMKGVAVDIGPGGPDGAGDASDPRVALAQAAIAAARKARPGT